MRSGTVLPAATASLAPPNENCSPADDRRRCELTELRALHFNVVPHAGSARQSELAGWRLLRQREHLNHSAAPCGLRHVHHELQAVCDTLCKQPAPQHLHLGEYLALPVIGQRDDSLEQRSTRLPVVDSHCRRAVVDARSFPRVQDSECDRHQCRRNRKQAIPSKGLHDLAERQPVGLAASVGARTDRWIDHYGAAISSRNARRVMRAQRRKSLFARRAGHRRSTERTSVTAEIAALPRRALLRSIQGRRSMKI